MVFHKKIRKRKFGEILQREGLISQEQLEEALAIQRKSGGFLGEILVEQGAITESDVVKTISIQYQIPFIRPSEYEIDRELLEVLEPEFLYSHRVLPFDRVHKIVLVVASDVPTDETLAALRKTFGCGIAIYVASATDLEIALRQLVPISEDEKLRFLEKRRLRFARAGAPPAAPAGEADEVPAPPAAAAPPEGAPAAAPAKAEPVAPETDSSWEAIFDEAEKNLRESAS